MKTYSEKLRDPRWQKKRLEIMERDKFCCSRCTDNESTLNVHHHYYKRGASPWDYHQSALTTLCEGCHECVESMKLDIAKSTSCNEWLHIVHTIAINKNFHFFSDATCALYGDETDEAKDARRRIISGLILQLNELDKSLVDGLNSFDRLILNAPDDCDFPEEPK